MRKNFKRTNYVLFGAIGIAAIALSSVGFATWITGMQKLTDDDNNITVNIDTATNKTLYIDAALEDHSLYIGEPTSASQATDHLNVINGDNSDLTIKFSTFRVIVSDYYDASSVSVAMKVEISGGKATYLEDKNGFTKTGGKTTYFNFPTTFVNNGAVQLTNNDSPLTGYKEKKLTSNEITLTWGDTFGSNGQSPSAYYNAQLDDGNKSINEKLTIMSKATNTLNEMYQALNGQTITLKFTVTAQPKSA